MFGGVVAMFDDPHINTACFSGGGELFCRFGAGRIILFPHPVK
jgi:hypothetical protein